MSEDKISQDLNSPKVRNEFGCWQETGSPLNDVKWGRPTQNWKSLFKMSPTEEQSGVVQDEHGCVTICSICDETYRDPVLLPCVHTFCLTCLQHIGTHIDKNPGDAMPCPLCRQEFTIPEIGYAALQKNVFMASLIEITSPKEGASGVCSKHEQEKLCLYCSECNEVLCLVCLRDCHPNHRMADLTSAAGIRRSQLQSNIGTAEQCMSDALKKKESLIQKKCAVFEKIQDVETEVCRVKLDLKELIDRHAESLLQDLSVLKEKRIEDIDIEEKELDKHLHHLTNFKIYCAELVSIDRHDSLLCKMANKLKEEIVDLKQRNQSLVERQLRSFDIHFTRTVPTSSEHFSARNTIGAVKEKVNYSEKPELITTIRANNTALNEDDDVSGISGMAVSNNDVFIAYECSPVVSVYDSHTHKCTAQMTLKGFVRKVNLKHCVSIAGNVYIVNALTREILRIDENRDFTKWSTKNDWGRLSVSAESTIVAACFETSALREYAPQGTLLHEIKLCSTIVHPLHAIKLDNGHFVVSHGTFRDDVNRVCMVDDAGRITKSFGNRKGYSSQQLDVATCLATDENGNILVLDRNNQRVLLLSPKLEFRQELLTKEDGLRRPVAMHLDWKTNKLYIADNNWENCRWNDSRVLVFNIK